MVARYALSDPQPLGLRCQSRIVANAFSIGLVARMWHQFCAERSQKSSVIVQTSKVVSANCDTRPISSFRWKQRCGDWWRWRISKQCIEIKLALQLLPNRRLSVGVENQSPLADYRHRIGAVNLPRMNARLMLPTVNRHLQSRPVPGH